MSWANRPLDEETPMEAVLDIEEPFETDEFSGSATPHCPEFMYTRYQTQWQILHGSNCLIASHQD
jgi:hypothetical protein